MIYFLVTTCLYNDCLIRKNQYINGITKLKKVIKDLSIENYKIIIIENNGLRPTFLDSFIENNKCMVYYTNNNIRIHSGNKGIKELKDLHDCIKEYNIQDDDFIVKLTGRYVLHDNSEFMRVVKNLPNEPYYCIIRYGNYTVPLPYKVKDSITGLIGMTCYYVKQIPYPPNEYVSVEWKWAETSYLIDDFYIYSVNTLGIDICPASNTYYSR
jgi:hypothetical protein